MVMAMAMVNIAIAQGWRWQGISVPEHGVFAITVASMRPLLHLAGKGWEGVGRDTPIVIAIVFDGGWR